MKSALMTTTLTALMLGSLSAAWAGTESTSGRVTTSTSTSTGTVTTTGNATSNATVTAPVPSSEENAAIQTIKQRSSRLSPKARAAASPRIEAAIDRVNQAAAAGEDKVTLRLTNEFGVSAMTLNDEHLRNEAPWGDVVVAHTLAANSKMDVSVKQLIELRKQLDWSQISVGMGYQLREALTAIRLESLVAEGTVSADGQVAVIHGEGSKAGVAPTASTAAPSGLATGTADANVGVPTDVKATSPAVPSKP